MAKTEQFVCSNKLTSLILIPKEKRDDQVGMASNKNDLIMVCGQDQNNRTVLHEMKATGQNNSQRSIPLPGQGKIV